MRWAVGLSVCRTASRLVTSPASLLHRRRGCQLVWWFPSRESSRFPGIFLHQKSPTVNQDSSLVVDWLISLSRIASFFGSGSKGADDICSHTYGRFSPSSPLSFHPPNTLIPASRLQTQPEGPNLSLKAPILALRLHFRPRGSNCSPCGSNTSPAAPIPASTLQSQPQGSNPSYEAPIPALRLQSQP